jgi:epoxyqueuosine reductase QueG
MDKTTLIAEITAYARHSAHNQVRADVALEPGLAGLKMYDDPLMGFADAADPLFGKLKEPGVIGGHFMLPGEWDSGAKTVIAIFFPFTREVKDANKDDPRWPAPAWLHARMEGQSFIDDVCNHLRLFLEQNGCTAVVPGGDRRFSAQSPVTADKNDPSFYTSNWSERHAAFIAGLGAFGLSRGLITAKGIAGRLGSVITGGAFEPDRRNYTEVYEYCTLCGGCVKNCPARAISKEQGKNHSICKAFLDSTREKFNPWYGCGKCQVNVPCENGIPAKQHKGAAA